MAQARDRSDQAAWRRLTSLYEPLVTRWVRPHVDQRADAEDLVQEVLATLVRELPQFDHNCRPGAFRTWLRRIAVNRLRAYWDRRATGAGITPPGALDELVDSSSALSRAWDEEHDRHVTRELLATIRLEFEGATWRAFERQVHDGAAAATVAAEMGLSVNAVLIAKSRVLKRLRETASGLIGEF